MSEIAEVFKKLESRFTPSAAAGVDVVFQFTVDTDHYHLIIKNSQCVLAKGEHPDPSVTLIVDNETFDELVAGELNGMQAYMSGRLRAEGDLMLATRLSEYFDI